MKQQFLITLDKLITEIEQYNYGYYSDEELALRAMELVAQMRVISREKGEKSVLQLADERQFSA